MKLWIVVLSGDLLCNYDVVVRKDDDFNFKWSWLCEIVFFGCLIFIVCEILEVLGCGWWIIMCYVCVCIGICLVMLILVLGGFWGCLFL